MASPTSLPAPTVYTVYQAVIQIESSQTLALTDAAQGTILLPSPFFANFTVISSAGTAPGWHPATLQANVPTNVSPYESIPSGTVIVYWNQPSTFTSVQFTSISLTASFGTTTISESTTAAASSSSFITTPPTSTVTKASLTFSPIQSVAVQTSTPPAYSAGIVAGTAISCAIAGVIIATCFFLCIRKKLLKEGPTWRARDKQLPLLRGHGQAVCAIETTGTGCEKQLPQAEDDSTIRSMASRTLDQIAMHVENFYTARRNIVLSEEQVQALQNIDSLHFSEPLSKLIVQSPQTIELIKHHLSNYVLSMISFDQDGDAALLLPKAYRQHWQSSFQDTSVNAQVWSRWRVLTAYLQSSSAPDQADIAERDAMIRTASQHVCKAFRIWATSEEQVRIQNMIGIMKHASELGMQFFSQPATFQWQWQPERRNRLVGASGSGDGMVVLPGLYKTTDHNAIPLTPPLHLIEPLSVGLERF